MNRRLPGRRHLAVLLAILTLTALPASALAPQDLAMFKDRPLEFAPGERWAYNNSAYVLLGAVIEKVSGKTYEE